jgi:hypothetical protein
MHAISHHVGADVWAPRDAGPTIQPMRAVVYLATGAPTSRKAAPVERRDQGERESTLLPLG